MIKKDNNNRFEQAKLLADEVIKIAKSEGKCLNESEQLMKLRSSNLFAEQFLKDITDADKFKSHYYALKYDEVNKEQNVLRLIKKIEYSRHRKRVARFISKISIAAAAIFICTFIVFRMGENNRTIISHNNKTNYEVPILILDDGKEVELLSVEDEIISKDYKIKKGKNNELVYESSDNASILNNRLIIPKCNMRILILSDGTEVELNANSELSYPVNFDKNVRKVELKGEAFFHVAKSDKPFVVSTDGASIKVYGTKFNINTNRTDRIETVLFEGSVGVTPDEADEVMLMPEHILILDKKTNKSIIEKVDLTKYSAWRDNYFRYENEPLSNVIDDMAAWYGVDFKCDIINIDKYRVLLTVSRERDLSQLLGAIEQSLNVKFIKEGGKRYTINEL